MKGLLMLRTIPSAVSRLRHLMSSFRRKCNERGEGVISLAIGVLIIAFLGAGMWIAFNATLESTQDKVATQVESIGG